MLFINYLTLSGLILLLISIFFIIVQIGNTSFINKETINKYQKISKIKKELRMDDEQKFIEHTWDSYYVNKIRNLTFKLGIALFPIGLLLYYVTS